MTMIGLCDGSQFLARCRLEVWKQTLRQSWQYTFIGTNECFALIELTIRFRHRYIQIMTGVKLKVLQEQFKETAIIQLFTSTLTIILWYLKKYFKRIWTCHFFFCLFNGLQTSLKGFCAVVLGFGIKKVDRKVWNICSIYTLLQRMENWYGVSTTVTLSKRKWNYATL